MNTLYLALATVLLFSSCAAISRQIASSQLNPPPLDDLLQASVKIIDDVEDRRFGESCVSYLRTLEDSLDRLEVARMPRGLLKKNAELIAENSWRIRSTLHQRLSGFERDCVLQVQATFRQLRFIEDYLLELARSVGHIGPADLDFQTQPVPLKENPSYYQTRLNGALEFRPGDLLITRGLSFLSGMIARLGRRSTQFSHVVMISQHPESKKIRTIESYVGVGVAFYDLEFALKNENARILWLRAKDPALATRASEMMADLLDQRLRAKNPIKYDYELNFEDASTMSCAEVSQVAFQMASNNQFRIPFYPNEISGAKSIIERLKLVEGPTYEPGDMEIDPRFELVGEFQDLRLTRDSRQKDAIMTALFDWMGTKNYELKDNLKSKMAGGVIYSARRTFLWPLVKKILGVKDFSKEIPRNMLKTVSLINELGELMLAELKARDLAFEKEHGVPMTYLEFYRTLEEMRREDLKLYQNKKTRKKSKIHKLIREA